MALAQATRVLPNLVTVLGWESCDHTGPVHEGDTLYSEVHVEDATPLADGRGGVLRLRSLVYAAGDDRQVLDWRFTALQFYGPATMGAVDVVEDWGASGLAYLTGDPTGPPDFSRAPVLEHARRVTTSFGEATGVDVDAAMLLAGRAGLLGFGRGGRVSAGGASRLFAARDGWCALTLSRSDDVDAVPALVEAAEAPADPWRAIESWAAARSAAEVAERARLLGLPAAALGEARATPVAQRRIGERTAPRGLPGLLVVDMSSMWAGPLCGQLLVRAGAVVVKVESRARPDGTQVGTRCLLRLDEQRKALLCSRFR